jgi:hypothetical protein
MKTNILLSICAISMAACVAPAKLVDFSNYEDIKSEPVPQAYSKNITLSFKQPVVTLVDGTQQIQTKGGVTISVAIVPSDFNVTYTTSETPSVVPVDAHKRHEYDRIERKETPQISTTTDNLKITIKVRNNSGKMLKLSEVGLAILQDQLLYDLPQESQNVWGKGMILNGFEKEYRLEGPKYEVIGNQAIYGIILQNVPVDYNEDGTVKVVEEFEWYFQCNLEDKQVESKINYSYYETPVLSRQCSSCGGLDRIVRVVVCSRCNGNGKLKAFDGSIVTCSGCSGSGKRNENFDCPATDCDKGTVYMPKSQRAKILSQTSVRVARYTTRVLTPGMRGELKGWRYNDETKSYDEVNFGVSPNYVTFEEVNSYVKAFSLTVNGRVYNVTPLKVKGSYLSMISIIQNSSGNLVSKAAAIQQQ